MFLIIPYDPIQAIATSCCIRIVSSQDTDSKLHALCCCDNYIWRGIEWIKNILIYTLWAQRFYQKFCEEFKARFVLNRSYKVSKFKDRKTPTLNINWSAICWKFIASFLRSDNFITVTAPNIKGLCSFRGFSG